MVADIAEDFVDAIVRIIDLDCHVYQSIREDALRFVDASFSSRRLVSSFKNILSRLNLPFLQDCNDCVLYHSKNSDRIYNEENSFCYYSNELARFDEDGLGSGQVF